MLQKMLSMQYAFGKKFTNFELKDESYKQLKIIEFVGHTIEELIEVRKELPIRKHWSLKRFDEPEWNKVKEEMIDVLHFVLTIFILLGMDQNDIYNEYTRKNTINYERQEEQ